MSLNPSVQFDETSITSAEFDAQDKVLPNSPVESNDVNAIASRALRRTRYLLDSLLAAKIIKYTFAEEGAGPTYVIGPPNTFTTNTWTDSKVTVDVPSCEVDDDLEIVCWGDWQLNTASDPSVVGRARIEIVEDSAGTPTIVPNLYGKASIVTPGGGTLPHVSNYHIALTHRVTAAGTASVTLQVRYEDLAGGADTATIILQLSARLDVKRILRS
jgi:hypothetical protein